MEKHKYTFQDFETYLFRRNGKYALISYSIAVIHVFYIYLFSRLQFKPLSLYNIIIVLLYIYFGAAVTSKNNFKNMYLFMAFEIPFHAIACTFVLGLEFKFLMFILTMIPAMFYISLFIEQFSHRIAVPSFFSVILYVIYVYATNYARTYAAYLPYEKIRMFEPFFSNFNDGVAAIMLIFFSWLFAIEHSYLNRQMQTENKTLDNFASYDTLTGLMNRRSIDRHLEVIFNENYRENESFSVIMCDIDFFKKVNDTYGHDVGDYVLKEVAKIIQSQVRDNDIAGRWGGEEFLVVLRTNKDIACKLAERIRSSVEAHEYTFKNITLKVTMTLGVSSYRAGNEIENVIKSADNKLYRGKQNGRNQVVS